MIIRPLVLGTITLYGLILSSAAALGSYLSWRLSDHDGFFLLDAGLGLSAGGLVGARLWYVLENWAYFRAHAWEIPQFWLGGLGWSGAVLAMILGMVLIHLIWKEPLGELADSLLPLLGLVAVGCWLLSWGTGRGFGPVTESWFGIEVRDLFGNPDQRWPLPLLGAFSTAVWIAGVFFFPIKRDRPDGFRFLIGLFGVLLAAGAASFLRVDPGPVLWGLRWESWFSILSLAGLGGLFYLFWK